MTKTDKKSLIRKALQICGYGRGFTKDYIHCPADEDLEEDVYNDLCFLTLDEVAEKAEEGDEVDAYVYSLNPVQELQENVIIYISKDNPRYNRTSRRGDSLPIETN